MARRPPRKSAPLAPTAPVEPPKPPERKLPEDPAERAKALASVEGEVALGLGLLDIIASRLPPARPLSKEEREMIQPHLAAVAYKYAGNLSPEAALAIAIGFVAVGRWVEVKAGKDAQLKIPGA